MEDRTLELEAETLEQARADAKAQTPPGLFILNEKVLADGKVRTAEGLADTAEEAAALAKAKVPADTKVVGETLKVAAGRTDIVTQAWDEESARAKVKETVPRTNRVEAVTLTTPGRKGVLGFGKSPATYSATVFQPAVYEVSYKQSARIRVTVGERKHAPTGYCQLCGRQGAPAKVGEKDIHYFCGSDCEQSYYKGKVRSLMAGAFVINATGQDISGMLSAGREAAARARVHCWSCGTSYPMDDKACSSCGKPQDIPV